MLGCLCPKDKVVETETLRTLPSLDVSAAMECRNSHATVTEIKIRKGSKFSAAVEKR